MKKLMSTNYSAGAFNFAMLFLRIGLGGLMIMAMASWWVLAIC
jgi:hypothetical protein